MQPQLIEKYARPVPRYTSYPTAPHFSEAVNAQTYRNWLSSLDTDQTMSLYVHIPFCDTLCWFCGCHTKHTRKYQPVADYLGVLKREIDTVAKTAAARPMVTRLHWGGGSPTILTGRDTIDLASHIRKRFNLANALEFSIEIDPRGLTDDQMDALAAAGMTRASIGVQDFNVHVQRHINRVQSFEETARVVEGLKRRQVASLNLDVMYGLPEQSLEDLEATVRRVLELDPDRIALFGYAHVPWMKKHQSMIRNELLPGPVKRFRQAEHAAELLIAAGYCPIGFDHFAKPGDGLALAAGGGQLRRNFQGYTDDDADALIGFGASAIGKLPDGYVQNAAATGDYMRRVDAGGFAVTRGYRLTEEDRMRAFLIERLMCDYQITIGDLEREFGGRAQFLFDDLACAAAADEDGMFQREGTRYRVTETGRPFVRSIAAAFDGFLKTGNARHSLAV